MIGFNFLTLLGLICVMCPCEGEVYPPPGGNILFFVKGSRAELPWSFDNDDDLSKITVVTRSWNFENSAGTSKLIASISEDNEPDIKSGILTGIEIKKPATLVLNNVDRQHNGKYTFTLVGDKTVSKEVTVVIAEKPTVTIDCSDTTTVNKRDDVICLCKGEGGRPTANVTWYDKNDKQIGETGMENQTLILRNVNGTYNGTYTCKAQSFTLIDEKSINVEVRPDIKPTVTSLSSNPVKPVVGGSFTITCEASGRPEPTYAIIYNGTEIVSTEKTHTKSKVELGHAGTYVCIATNPLGNDSEIFTLIVGQSPTTIPTSKGNETVAKDEESGSGSLGGGAIAGIVIGVLVVVVIVAGVIYWFKFKPNGKDHGSRKDTEEKAKKKRGDENVYDAVNMDDKASGSRSSHELESPMNYAVLDKNALNTGAPKKPERNAEESTAYASIDVGKVGQVEADLV